MASLAKLLPSKWRSTNDQASAEPAYRLDSGSESASRDNQDIIEKESLKAIDSTGVVIKEAENASPGALTLEEGSYLSCAT